MKVILTNIIHFKGLVIPLIFVCSLLQAQTSIQFISSENYQPIEKVTLFNADKSITAVSNADGTCILPEKISSQEILTIQHLSFLEEQVSVAELQKNNPYLLIPKSVELEELVIAVSKSEESAEAVSNKVDIIDANELKLSNPQTSADVLTQTGNVYIQKSQMGGGSPVIRGFEANKVLIAVDGVKLNNAIYRGGHLQNVITIDPGILERAEVVYGPGSLIYGSDAIGGVMHFITKNPKFSKDDSFKLNGNAMLRSATANQEKTAHVDFSSSFGKWASLSSISFSDFGDLTIGKKRTDSEGSWGQLPYLVTQENGYDDNIENPNPNQLTGTAYHQLDILQKLIFKPNEQHQYTLNFQYSTSSEIPRFDRLNDLIEEDINTRPQPKWAKWAYGPQNRLLASLQHRYTANEHRLFNQINTTVAFQKIDEDRIKRKFASEQTVFNEEDVQVFSLNSDATKILDDQHQLQYGIELTHNLVASDAYLDEQNERLPYFVLSRYPNEGSSMSTASVYLRHKYQINERLSFSDGIRFSLNRLSAQFSDEVDIPQKSFTGTYGAITGAAGLTWRVNENTRFLANAGTGFRAPNVDDSGKFFDPQEGMVVIPNFNIKPEYIVNADVGLHQQINNIVSIKLDAFYNYLFNAIVRRPAQLNGLDSLVFDGLKSQIFNNQNAGRAIVYGFSAGLKVRFGKHVKGYTHHNYTRGIDLTEQVPLGHIPPQFGEAGVQLNYSKIETRVFIRYNSNKPENLYSPFGEDKESEALEELYTPAWSTLNVNFNYTLNNFISISGGVENILDTHYKPFSSGISGPGRNFVLALRSSF